MQELTLQAPMTGWALPLAEVPDPVFAQGMAGQGLAIDPTDNRLYAPYAGEITQVHRCRHALTLRLEAGPEVLMHVGIDSVQLGGEGFQPRVKVGDKVEAGALLLEFDADLVARRCRSLITVVVLPENPALRAAAGKVGEVRQGQDWLQVSLQGEAGATPPEEEAEQVGDWLTLPNPVGMHARPAARLLALVRDMPGPVWLESERDRASARSLVGLLGLGLAQGDKLRLRHSRLTAQQLETLEKEIRAGLGDDLSAPAVTATVAPTPAAAPVEGKLRGVIASGGVAVGPIYRWERVQFSLPDQVGERSAEEAAWKSARQRARAEIESLRERAPAHERGIFAAHLEVLEDPELTAQVQRGLASDQGAARAWQAAYEGQASKLEALPNPLLAARAGDLRDVGERLLRVLLGVEAGERSFPDGCVVVARDLNPSETVQLDPQKVKGLCLAQGGPSSHVAILSRSLGIPSLCALGGAVLDLPAGRAVVLDAETGFLNLEPDAAALESARVRLTEIEARRTRERAAAHESAHTGDGVAVEVAVNIGKAADLHQGLEQGAEGVGLFRTEFYFHELDHRPTVAEQREVYQELARATGKERRLVARLLDVGGDKPLPYLGMAPEENPFLGVRGIRLFTRHPDLFRDQLEALLACASECRLAIMVPMISSLREWLAIKSEIVRIAAGRPVELGVMIEVPAAALIADRLAPEVDFFSIGTNDLTQYTLAIDRGHPDLAAEVDALHPALLHLIRRVGEAAQAHGRWVGVCGGAAQDFEAIPLLLAMNVRELSVSPPAVPAVKAEVRRWELPECRKLLEEALQLAEPDQVRKLVKERRK